MKTFIIVFAFFISLNLFAQKDNSNDPSFNGISLKQADSQPFKSAVLYTDSAGVSYISMICRIMPDGTLLTDENAGVNGASLLIFKGLTAAEIEYISAFIQYRAARNKLEK